MDKEEIESRIDFDNIQEKTFKSQIEGFPDKKVDYLVDFEGNFILPLNHVEFKLIEEIKALKARIKVLEDK